MSTQPILDNDNPELIQGSVEWLASRNRYIGASDISTIMGYNKYKTPYQLWQQKLGILPPEEATFAMERGKELEPKALVHVEKAKNIEIASQPVYVDSTYDFIRVSLDGVSCCGQYIVEAKSPMSVNSETHVHTTIGGSCPLVHYCQVQLCLHVAKQYHPKLKGAFYVSYIDQNPEESIIIEVLPDPKFVDRLIKNAIQFWDLVQKKVPPLMGEDEYENIELADNCDQWQNLVLKYLEVNQLEKNILTQKNDLRKKMIELSANRNIQGYGVKLYHSKKKGSVQFKKIPELKHVDLEQYRSDPTVVSTIKIG